MSDAGNECPYCRSTNSEYLEDTKSRDCGDFCIRHCQCCTGYFISPKPSVEILAKAYDGSYYGSGTKKFSFGISTVIDFFRKRRVAQLSKLIPAMSNVLDIGCGDGAFLKCFIERGHNGFGTELDGPAAKRAAQVKGLHLHVGEVTAAKLPARHFDFISLCHVFEHLQNPKETLQRIERLIKPGGNLLISLPNIAGNQSRKYRGAWFHLDPPRHLFFFDRKTLIKELEQLGFTLSAEKHFSLIFDPFGFQQSTLNLMCKKRDNFYEYLKGNREVTKSISIWSLLSQVAFCAVSLPLFLAWSFNDARKQKGATMELVFRKESLPK